MVRTPDEDIYFFNMVARVLQGDILTLYLVIICLDYVLRMSIDLIKENFFKLKKGKKQTIPYRNYNRRWLCRWPSASRKYSDPNQIPDA